MLAKDQLYYFVDIQEHTYDLKTLSNTFFPHSNINLLNIPSSLGVRPKQVESLFNEGVNNVLERPVPQTYFCGLLKKPLSKRDHYMEAFLDLLPQTATVIREGREIEIDIQFIVYGDLIILKEGEVCPADCRIIWIQEELLVDVSVIKGKTSEPVSCTTYMTDALPLKTHNLVFAGSKIMKGKGIGLAIAVGERRVQIRIVDYVLAKEMGVKIVQPTSVPLVRPQSQPMNLKRTSFTSDRSDTSVSSAGGVVRRSSFSGEGKTTERRSSMDRKSLDRKSMDRRSVREQGNSVTYSRRSSSYSKVPYISSSSPTKNNRSPRKRSPSHKI
ncbi:hypothetical protein FDP41_008876 [Naegleria fowleri]|uniref:P-type ATPase A domain-containing protein n=1 Tax=Naegleria fowleri TaxID=5763 RepID=A0A6A5B3D1_NAEFO|nr:uncharacterized protein FDP41_008876 [Naegleria fowleri]KAF0972627.1 hypothetical protein FDP41_008876 [Naegleria fowleri]CAG4718682.1 unnamed protein product [Naegleria fowleri]